MNVTKGPERVQEAAPGQLTDGEVAPNRSDRLLIYPLHLQPLRETASSNRNSRAGRG